MNQDTKQQRNHPFDTIFQELAEAVQEIDRLKAENAILRRSQAGQSILIQQAPHAMECNLEQDAPFDGVQCNCWKSKWDRSALREALAPTVELLESWVKYMRPYTGFINIVNQTKSERSRLTALMEVKP